MKLWILRPREDLSDEKNVWDNPYDKVHGFIIRAKSEEDARKIAQENGADETGSYEYFNETWLNSEFSICKELPINGEEGVVMKDFWSG